MNSPHADSAETITIKIPQRFEVAVYEEIRKQWKRERIVNITNETMDFLRAIIVECKVKEETGTAADVEDLIKKMNQYSNELKIKVLEFK